MIDLLTNLDAGLFQFLNVKLANLVFDAVMPIVTNDWVLRFVFLTIVILLLSLGGKRGRIVAFLCVAAVALSDQTSSHLIKPLVERTRPCHVEPDVHLLVACSKGLSFPSSHAANSFAVAVLISFAYRRRVWVYLTAAALVSYSRIAVGVHYPLDVFAGAVVGTVCAGAIYLAFTLASRRLRGKHLLN